MGDWCCLIIRKLHRNSAPVARPAFNPDSPAVPLFLQRQHAGPKTDIYAPHLLFLLLLLLFHLNLFWSWLHNGENAPTRNTRLYFIEITGSPWRCLSANCLINASNFGEEPSGLKASCFTGQMTVSSFSYPSFSLSLCYIAVQQIISSGLGLH